MQENSADMYNTIWQHCGYQTGSCIEYLMPTDNIIMIFDTTNCQQGITNGMI